MHVNLPASYLTRCPEGQDSPPALAVHQKSLPSDPRCVRLAQYGYMYHDKMGKARVECRGEYVLIPFSLFTCAFLDAQILPR